MYLFIVFKWNLCMVKKFWFILIEFIILRVLNLCVEVWNILVYNISVWGFCFSDYLKNVL